MKYEKELLKGNTDTLLLSLINLQPMYGYQIIKELNRRSEGYFKFGEGTLYPALHRLERKGLLTSRWERLPSGQERKYYIITERGRVFLEAKKEEWQKFSTAINLVLQIRGG